MPRSPFRPFTSRYVVLPGENIDTDQIIPARYLTTTESTGLGQHAFHDWRYLPDGTPNPNFPLNAPSAAGARILVAGKNFGCGSSREHAVWALQGAGFHAVVSSQFADIFRGNALGNGLLPIEVSKRMLARLMDVASSQYMASLAIDLETQTVQLPDGDIVKFPIAPFAKHCVLEGIGEMDFLLGATERITAFEATRS
ncbi:MAG: 3-isopropylmalate dehydratase small subunit [Gemmatimonadaceae bacterium]